MVEMKGLKVDRMSGLRTPFVETEWVAPLMLSELTLESYGM